MFHEATNQIGATGQPMSSSRRMCDLTRGIMTVALAGLLLVRPAAAASVQWHDSFEEAIARSRPLNQPIWLEFWATWCAPCKVMDAEVYTNEDVIQASRPFVAVRVDFDRKTVLARQYNVTALPTFVFTDSDGDELFRYSGAIAAAPLAELLRSLPQDVAAFNRLGRLLAADKNNVDALERMGRALRDAGLFRTSNGYYRRALQRSPGAAGVAIRASVLPAMAANYLETHEAKLAADAFTRCLKEFPGNPHALEWQVNIGRAYLLSDNRDKGRKYLEAFVREHPGSTESQTARRWLGD